MRKTGPSLRLGFLSAFLVLAALAASAQAALPRRSALVVGNGAYASNPLRNPPNDAEDVAAALRDSGFDVTLVKDASLEVLEKAVNDFAARLKGADTALFYYAGHGVAVDGMNYLIPVSPRIDDVASVKSRAVAVDAVVGKMEATGVRTTLVFLDSCRDNPFPGASRSGTRGLAVVAAPKTVNSLIAYATSPGDVAQDGTGRNGVFSGAFIGQLKEPGLELSAMMKNVKAEVASRSAGKQQPRVDDGMKENFYFISPEQLANRAQAALEANKAEVARLEKELADRKSKIDASRDTQAKQALEVEQQRQQAITLAKRLETENLAREAEKQRKLAAEAAILVSQKNAAATAQSRQQDELATLASVRRSELEKLAQTASSDNPDILIDTVERLAAVLAEVDGQYSAALARSHAVVNESWNKQLASLSTQTPDITETDAEFSARMSNEKARLEADRQSELDALLSSAETQRTSQTQAMRTQFDDTLNTLQTKSWTVAGKGATLIIGQFDRNERTWPFTVGSADPLVPMLPISIVAELGKAPDPRAAILALDAAVKAGALAAEFDWGITREVANKRYNIDIRVVRVRNLTTNDFVAVARPNQRAAYFTVGKRDNPFQSGVGSLIVGTKAGSGEAAVYVDGKKLGTTPLTLKLPVGTVLVQVRWADNYSNFSQQVGIVEGYATIVSASKNVLRIGDGGPAGGLIFYDKGNVSDGWRYLEAAPSDQSTGIQWYNGNYVSTGATATGIGNGKSNTATIIAKQGAGNNAATLCDQLVLGGFDDWFLPSKDELNLMYTNLKKAGRGDFGSAWYWSSSEKYYDYSWEQGFGVGSQSYNGKNLSGCVRAVRGF